MKHLLPPAARILPRVGAVPRAALAAILGRDQRPAGPCIPGPPSLSASDRLLSRPCPPVNLPTSQLVSSSLLPTGQLINWSTNAWLQHALRDGA
jgi:hypothetical protein